MGGYIAAGNAFVSVPSIGVLGAVGCSDPHVRAEHVGSSLVGAKARRVVPEGCCSQLQDVVGSGVENFP
jgi:hypothetical protein